MQKTTWMNCASLAALAVALGAPGVSQAAENDGAQIQELVVTARRVEERLQDIPASVSAVAGAQLAQVKSLQDIQGMVPGLVMKTFGPLPSISLRGYGNRPQLFGTNSSVGIYEDGVYLSPYLVALSTSLDVARIEVAKGPQSTLYGRSSLAGAINVVTPDPSQTPEGFAEVGYGGASGGSGENLYHAKLVLSGPLTDTLSGRLALVRMQRDGYVYDPVTRYRGLGYNRTGARLKLMWQPNDDLKVRLGVSIIHDDAPRGETLTDRVIPPLGNLPGTTPNPLNLAANQAILASFNGRSVWQSRFTQDQVGKINGQDGTLDIRYNTPFGELASLSNYQRTKSNLNSNADLVAASADVILVTDEERYSQEFRLSGKSGALSYLAGGYYLWSNFENGRPGATVDRTGALVVFKPGSAPYDLLNVYSQLAPGNVKTKAIAAFAQVGYDVTDKLNITAGIRESQDKISGVAANYFVLRNGALVTRLAPLQRRAKFKALTGSAIASYKVMPDVLVYASYGRGDSPGGLQGTTVTLPAASLQNFRPQKVDAFEVGLKSQFLDRRVQLNVALFDNEYKDLQIVRNQNVQVPGTTTVVGQQLTVNAGQSHGRGVDADLLFVINSNWRANASYTYSDSKIDKYDLNPADPSLLDLTGISLYRAPKHTAAAGVTYSADLGEGQLSITADANYTSSYINDTGGFVRGVAYPGRPAGAIPGQPAVAPGVTTSQVLFLARTKGYSLFNLSSSYTTGPWQVSAYVRNLLNKQYIAVVAAGDPANRVGGSPGEPRTFEVSLKRTF
jgi:iron complex outermembrane receptor protein